jgi:hypothetical protein
MPWLNRRSTSMCTIFPLVVVMALTACSIGGGGTPVAPSSSQSPSPVVADPSNQASGRVTAGPPVAALAAEGGDPTDGQLGSYTWGDGGSDAPWLPGARMAVGAGEPLTVSFQPEANIQTWSARAVPATSDGPANATALGGGSGRPRFAAPDAGTWTVEVRVVFADAAGRATYFWQLAVD